MKAGRSGILGFLLVTLAIGLPAGESLAERLAVAPSGAVIEVPAGTYAGPLEITRPVTLRGIDWPLIEGNGRGPVIKILADGVTVEGFRIENSGLELSEDHAGVLIEGNRAVVCHNRIERVLHGIYVKGGKYARIEGNTIDGLIYLPLNHADVFRDGFASRPTELCTVALEVSRRGNGIHLWNSEGHQIRDNVIRRTRDGIYFSFTNQTWVYHNTVSQVRYGLHYMYSDGNTFEENRFEENAAGAAIMYSEGIRAEGNHFFNNRGKRAYGLLLQSVDDSVFSANEIAGNTIGLYLENSQRNAFRGNLVERNYVGLRFSVSSSDNRLSRNRFHANLHPVELDQASAMNQWAENGIGNDWSTNDSPDLDGDRIGEWAHRESDVLGPLRREHPLAGLLSGTAFVDLLRFASSRGHFDGLPAIEDPHPLNPSK